jgi:MSHA pilin protein MshD
MFIVIVSVAIAGILPVMNMITSHSADAMLRKQALAIAESLLEEVEMQYFTYCDPDDANAAVATAATTAQCPKAGGIGGVEAMGPETDSAGTETRNAAPLFDNVSDYNGFSSAAVGGIKDFSGNVISVLAGYTATVSVAPVALGNITLASGDALQITVTVVAPGGQSIVLDGYRTRYAPNMF